MRERGISMEAYADDLAELLDAIGVSEPIVLAGFSMGGYVAWQFVRKHGHRLRALVQCDTRAKADTDEARAGRIKMAENIAEWGSGRVAEMMGPKLFAPATFEKQPEIVAAVRKVIERTPPAGIAAAQRGMAARPDVTEMLPHINVPTLVLVGEHDAISPPAEMKEIADAIPGCGVRRDSAGRPHDDDGRSGGGERGAGAIRESQLRSAIVANRRLRAMLRRQREHRLAFDDRVVVREGVEGLHRQAAVARFEIDVAHRAEAEAAAGVEAVQAALAACRPG